MTKIAWGTPINRRQGFSLAAGAAFSTLIRPARAQSRDVAAAEKEGAVKIYTLWLTEEVQAMAKAFEKKYPAIKVEFFRQGGPTITERYKSELRVGASADIVSLDTALLAQLAAEDLVEPYDSPELTAYDDHWKTTNRTYSVPVQYAIGMMINKKSYPDKAEWPTDWPDFKAPRPSWKGKVSVGDIRVLSHAFDTLAALNGKYGDETWQIYAGLAAANSRISTGAPQAREWASSGQFPIVFEIPFQLYVAAAISGAPVGFIAPRSGMVPHDVGISLGKKSAHPNAARLFYDFILSEEGQAVFAAQYLTPTRRGSSMDWSPPGETSPLKTATFMAFDPIAADKKRETLVAQGSKALGLQ